MTDDTQDPRARALAIAADACGESGRVLGDPVFEAITGGRASARGYSACGDLAHYVLRELGRDLGPWKMSTNISSLVYGMGDAFVWARRGLMPNPGDILYMALPEHVCVLQSVIGASIISYDYGQSIKGKPAGKTVVRAFSVTPAGLMAGNRTIRGWVDLDRALEGIK